MALDFFLLFFFGGGGGDLILLSTLCWDFLILLLLVGVGLEEESHWDGFWAQLRHKSWRGMGIVWITVIFRGFAVSYPIQGRIKLSVEGEKKNRSLNSVILLKQCQWCVCVLFCFCFCKQISYFLKINRVLQKCFSWPSGLTLTDW